MSLIPSASVSNRMRQEYAQHRQRLEAAEEQIHQYVIDQTQDERAALVKAHKALQKRQSGLLVEAEMQRQQQEYRKAGQQLEQLGAKLEALQHKALRQIREMAVPDAEKLRLWEQVQEAVERIVHSEDELQALQAFKQQFRDIVRGQQQRLAGPNMH